MIVVSDRGLTLNQSNSFSHETLHMRTITGTTLRTCRENECGSYVSVRQPLEVLPDLA